MWERWRIPESALRHSTILTARSRMHSRKNWIRSKRTSSAAPSRRAWHRCNRTKVSIERIIVGETCLAHVLGYSRKIIAPLSPDRFSPRKRRKRGDLVDGDDDKKYREVSENRNSLFLRM